MDDFVVCQGRIEDFTLAIGWSSHSAYAPAIMMAPSSCPVIPMGLMTVPLSVGGHHIISFHFTGFRVNFNFNGLNSEAVSR